MKFMQNLLDKLQESEAATPKFKADRASAFNHIDKYKVWLRSFMQELGYATEDAYLELHILRKHIIVQTIAAQQGKYPSNVKEAVRCLDEFSSKQWFGTHETMATLRKLVPDQAEYLTAMGGVCRPWQLSST